MFNLKKIILPSVVILVAFTLASYFGARYISKDNSGNSLKLPKSLRRQESNIYVLVGENKIFVEIADTPSDWQIGLSEHDSLKKDNGMLFIFEDENVSPSFWMEGMSFDIDILWINDGKVTQIDQNVPKPEPDTPSSELPLYQPYDVIDYVLEVSSGYVKEKGVAVNDTVDLSQIDEVN